MSSMDVDPPEEKKTSQEMPSAVSNGPPSLPSKMKDTKPGTTTEDVAADEKKEEHANDSVDDSSVLSDVLSPVLSRTSISEVNARTHIGSAAEKEDAMEIVDPVELKKLEVAEEPSETEEEKHDEDLPDAPSHLSPSAPPANSEVGKDETAVEASEQEATNDPSKTGESISPISPPAPLLTTGTGTDSSNRAQSPSTAPESVPEKQQETERLPEPETLPEPEKLLSPEPEPVVELTADEKEALMSLNAMLSTVPPAVARAAVKEHASKCLLGFSPDETAFLDGIFTAASDQVVKKFIDANGGRILDVANQQYKSFLDRALEIRLKDIDGTALARYLARADRLGFEEQDEVDGESVMPIPRNGQFISSDPPEVGDRQMQPMYGMPHASGAIVQQHWPAPPPGMMYDPAVYSQPGFPLGAQMKHCPKCGAGFKQNAGLKYHIEHDVCKKAGTPMGPVMARCESCGKEFRSPGGYHYHITNKVCNQPAKESSPQPDGQAPTDPSASHPVSSSGQQPQAKDEDDPRAPPAQAPAPIASHPPVPSSVPQMFQNTPQQPYQGPYQNPPPQHHYQQPPPPPQVLPSHGLAMPTAASGERIGNANGLLTPEQAHKLNEDLKAEDRKYAAQLDNLDPSLEGQAREIEIKRLKAGMSTRKSNLRRKHGIFVRKTDKTAANAVRNEDGSIDLAPAGKTVSVGSGFAPINGPSASASPAPQAASRGPESPAAGEPDPKRRRVSDYPPQSPYPQPGPVGPTGYPPNYNMHPGSYDPRQQHHMPQGTYQQYGMSPYTQQSPYSQHPPMHQPYAPPPPGYQMNTIIRAPGAPPSAQSPGMPMQGPSGPGYFPPQSGFVSVNGSQPPPPTPPPGFMTIVSPAPQPYPPVVNGQAHGLPPPPPPPPQSSTPATPRGSSAAPVENGVSKPKVPTDNAEKVWKAKQKERDWVVQTGPQHAFTRMDKESSAEKDGKKPDEKKQDGKKKSPDTKQKKPTNEFHVPITDDEATDEDESARRPSTLDGTAEEPRMVRRASSTSSELSELDDSAILGAGEGGEPYIVAQASDSASEAAKKPAEKKQHQLNFTPEQSRPALPSSGFMAINMPYSHPEDLEEREYDSEEHGNLRPPPEMKMKKAKQAREAAMRAGASASRPQQIDGTDDDLEQNHEILQVASEDEMQIDSPPPQRRRQAAGGSNASGSGPPSSSAAGTPTAPGQLGQPKKRLGRPVGWKKGMGGYRELLDKGVVHHNEEGTPASRRRAEKRAAERLRRQTEGEQGGQGGGELPAQGAKPAASRKSVG